ncbi:MAG: response regulator transcription factor [Undibacterium sp.]|uniref:response regulator n=1 Tax=Undibacterium sp. TaxID=1914977 RepID=UPI0027186BFD|nr:response regulator transcription factor [Undibacterium sp.]MDO8653967.1 response regulator transcription factor [Undibacterium sp.]
MTLRLLLADDHTLFRQALRMILETERDIIIVAEATDGYGVLNAVEQSKPDVVCMDINMPKLNGVEATQQLHAVHPEVKIIGLSSHIDPYLVAQMIHAGALAYVDKAHAGIELIAAIRMVNQNQPYLSPELGINNIDELALYMNHTP